VTVETSPGEALPGDASKTGKQRVIVRAKVGETKEKALERAKKEWIAAGKSISDAEFVFEEDNSVPPKPEAGAVPSVKDPMAGIPETGTITPETKDAELQATIDAEAEKNRANLRSPDTTGAPVPFSVSTSAITAQFLKTTDEFESRETIITDPRGETCYVDTKPEYHLGRVGTEIELLESEHMMANNYKSKFYVLRKDIQWVTDESVSQGRYGGRRTTAPNKVGLIVNVESSGFSANAKSWLIDNQNVNLSNRKPETDDPIINEMYEEVTARLSAKDAVLNSRFAADIIRRFQPVRPFWEAVLNHMEPYLNAHQIRASGYGGDNNKWEDAFAKIWIPNLQPYAYLVRNMQQIVPEILRSFEVYFRSRIAFDTSDPSEMANRHIRTYATRLNVPSGSATMGSFLSGADASQLFGKRLIASLFHGVCRLSVTLSSISDLLRNVNRVLLGTIFTPRMLYDDLSVIRFANVLAYLLISLDGYKPVSGVTEDRLRKEVTVNHLDAILSAPASFKGGSAAHKATVSLGRYWSAWINAPRVAIPTTADSQKYFGKYGGVSHYLWAHEPSDRDEIGQLQNLFIEMCSNFADVSLIYKFSTNTVDNRGMNSVFKILHDEMVENGGFPWHSREMLGWLSLSGLTIPSDEGVSDYLRKTPHLIQLHPDDLIGDIKVRWSTIRPSNLNFMQMVTDTYGLNIMVDELYANLIISKERMPRNFYSRSSITKMAIDLTKKTYSHPFLTMLESIHQDYLIIRTPPERILSTHNLNLTRSFIRKIHDNLMFHHVAPYFYYYGRKDDSMYWKRDFSAEMEFLLARRSNTVVFTDDLIPLDPNVPLQVKKGTVDIDNNILATEVYAQQTGDVIVSRQNLENLIRRGRFQELLKLANLHNFNIIFDMPVKIELQERNGDGLPAVPMPMELHENGFVKTTTLIVYYRWHPRFRTDRDIKITDISPPLWRADAVPIRNEGLRAITGRDRRMKVLTKKGFNVLSPEQVVTFS
jgi:hypothetical protein